MNVLDAINAMLSQSGTSKAALAAALGRSRQSVGNMFVKGTDVYVDTLIKMADYMGYEVVLRKEGESMVLTAKGGSADK